MPCLVFFSCSLGGIDCQEWFAPEEQVDATIICLHLRPRVFVRVATCIRGQLAMMAASPIYASDIFGAKEGLDEELDIRHSIHKPPFRGIILRLDVTETPQWGNITRAQLSYHG